MESLKPFRMLKLEIESFKGIKALFVDAAGRHVTIEGPNGAGKTSATDALWFVIKGLERGADNPVHVGDNHAWVRLTISNDEQVVTIVRTIDRDGKATLTVQDQHDEPMGGKAFLESLLGKYAHDPIRFLGKTRQEQLDDMLAISTVPPPVEDVEAITGLVYPPNEGESAYRYLMRLSADKTGVYYQERRDAGRELQVRSKSLEDATEQLRNTPEVVEITSQAAMMDELTVLHQAANDRQAVFSVASQARQVSLSAQQNLFSAQRDLSSVKDEIDELNRRLATATNRQKNIENSVASIQTDISLKIEARRVADLAVEAVNGDTDPAIKIAELKTRMAASEKLRSDYSHREGLKKNVLRLRQEVKDAQEAVTVVDGQMSDLRQLRRTVAANIDFGIKGLVAAEEGPMLNDLPLASACMSDQLDAAVAISVMQNPQLRLLRIDEGERLDMRSRYRLFNYADQNNFQVVMTSVSNQHDSLTITIHD